MSMLLDKSGNVWSHHTNISLSPAIVSGHSFCGTLDKSSSDCVEAGWKAMFILEMWDETRESSSSSACIGFMGHWPEHILKVVLLCRLRHWSHQQFVAGFGFTASRSEKDEEPLLEALVGRC